MNVVSLVGRVVEAPEHKTLAGGRTVCKFVLQIKSRYDSASGEKREDITDVECVAWRGAADNIAKFVHAGDQLAIQGSLKTERWQWQNKECSKLKVSVEKFDLLGSPERRPAPVAQAAGKPTNDDDNDSFLNP